MDRDRTTQGAVFVTRPKTNMRLDIVGERPVAQPQGDGFTVLNDTEVRFASKGDSQLPIRLRRLARPAQPTAKPSPC